MQLNTDFKNLIKDLNKGNDLFYNSEGNSEAFKLFVRHISFAENLNYGIMKNGYFYPNKEILLVDFDKQIISKINNKLKVKALKFYE